MSGEQQYLDLVRDVINDGYTEDGRNGRTRVQFGKTMRFSLADGVIPILNR